MPMTQLIQYSKTNKHLKIGTYKLYYTIQTKRYSYRLEQPTKKTFSKQDSTLHNIPTTKSQNIKNNLLIVLKILKSKLHKITQTLLIFLSSLLKIQFGVRNLHNSMKILLTLISRFNKTLSMIRSLKSQLRYHLIMLYSFPKHLIWR